MIIAEVKKKTLKHNIGIADKRLLKIALYF